MKQTKTVDVPARGRKWVTGAIVRDRATNTLYRVAGKPIRYHEDCLPMQRVTLVRQVPTDWTTTQRILAIMEHVRATGTHTPQSGGAYGRPAEQVAEQPASTIADTVRWEARQDVMSCADYPEIAICGDILRFSKSIYDDAPIVTWLRDAVLADEARTIIASKPSLVRYPAVNVRA